MNRPRAGAFLRVSADPSQGGTSIDGQEVQAYKDAEKVGADLRAEDIFSETVSASIYGRRAGKVRNEWQKFMERMPDLDFAILPEISRGTRELGVYEELAEAAYVHNVTLVVKGRILDLEDDSDFTMSGIEIVMAAAESKRISRRVKRGVRGANAAGRAPVGRTPFGFTRPPRKMGEPVVQVINPAEAQAIKDAAEGILAEAEEADTGTTLTRIVELWSERFPGRTWTPNTVRRALRNPALIGKRKHLDQLHDAAWPPILDPITFYQLDSIFKGRELGAARKSSSLLSTIAKCGVCGDPIKIRRPPDRGPFYRCTKGHVGAPEALADKAVLFPVLARMYWEAVTALESGDPDASARAVLEAAEAEAQAARTRLEEWYSEGAKSGLPASEVAAMAKGYREALDAAEDAVRTAQRGVGVRRKREWWDSETPEDARVLDRAALGVQAVGTWFGWTLERRRQEVQRLVTVIMNPAKHDPRFVIKSKPGMPTTGPEWPVSFSASDDQSGRVRLTLTPEQTV